MNIFFASGSPAIVARGATLYAGIHRGMGFVRRVLSALLFIMVLTGVCFCKMLWRGCVVLESTIDLEIGGSVVSFSNWRNYRLYGCAWVV